MTDAEAGPDVRRGRNRLAAIIVVGHAVKHLYNSGLSSIILPELKIGMGLSSAQFGSLASVRSLAAGMSTMTAGYLGDRFSHQAGLLIGLSLGIMGMAHLLAGYAPNYGAMLAVMFVIGIGPSMFHPPAISALSRRFPDRRGFAISLHGMGANAGEVLGPITVAGVLSLLMWRDVLKVSFVPALLAGLLIWVSIRSLPGGKEATGVKSLGDYVGNFGGLLGNRLLMVLVAAVALRAVGDGAVAVFVPVLLREELQYSAATVAFYLTSAKLVGLASQPTMGYLSDRYGRKAVLVPATAATSLLAFGLSVAEPGVQLYIVVAASGAFSFSLHHIFIAAAIDAAQGPLQSTVAAMIYSAGFMAIFSPYVAGLISDAWGIHSAFVYGGSVLVLPTALLLTITIPVPGKRSEAKASA